MYICMPKTQRKPSKPKLKQKQKQRQHQTVVVNVIQPKRIATRTPRRGGTTGAGGGGAGGGNYVAYRSPIINDPYIPQQFQQIPTINFPQQALENKPTTTPLIEYPTPTTLQTVSADVRPLVALRENTPPPTVNPPPTPPRQPSPPAVRRPVIVMPGMSMMDELRQVQENREAPGSMADEIKKLKKSVARDEKEAIKEGLGTLPPPSKLILKNRKERASRLQTLIQGGL